MTVQNLYILHGERILLSEKVELECGIPQGSYFGTHLFTINTIKLPEIIKFHLPSTHAHADDTHIYFSFTTIENCIRAIRAWMEKNKLMLNDDKTEILLIGTQKQLSKVSISRIFKRSEKQTSLQ